MNKIYDILNDKVRLGMGILATILVAIWSWGLYCFITTAPKVITIMGEMFRG